MAGDHQTTPSTTPLALNTNAAPPSGSSAAPTSSSTAASASLLSTQPTLSTAPSTITPGQSGPTSSSTASLPAFGFGAAQPAAGLGAFGALPGQTAAAGAAAPSSSSGDQHVDPCGGTFYDGFSVVSEWLCPQLCTWCNICFVGMLSLTVPCARFPR